MVFLAEDETTWLLDESLTTELLVAVELLCDVVELELVAALLPLVAWLPLCAEVTFELEDSLTSAVAPALDVSVAALAVTVAPVPNAISMTAQAKTQRRPLLYILKCVRFVSILIKSLPFPIRFHLYFRTTLGNNQYDYANYFEQKLLNRMVVYHNDEIG